MPIKTRIDPIATSIDLIVANTLSPAAQKAAVANFARTAIAEVDDTNRRVLGRIPPRTITVDGQRGGALENVRPNGGSIIVEWEIVTDVLIWIAQTLEARSPHVSGEYQHSHALLADGVLVNVGQNVPVADEYMFVNTVDYARRIEVGKIESGRDFVIQVPNRIYERTAKDAKSKFGKIAKITSTFVTLQDSYKLQHNQASRSFSGGKVRVSARQRPDRVKGSSITYPAIIVSQLSR